MDELSCDDSYYMVNDIKKKKQKERRELIFTCYILRLLSLLDA